MKTCLNRIVTTVLLSALPLVLGASPLYWGGGSANIADNTDTATTGVLLEGTWNATLENWADATLAPNSYGTWVDGSFAFLGRRVADGNTPVDPDVTLETSIAATGLMNNSLANTNHNLLIDLTAVDPVTIDTGTGSLFVVRTAGGNATSGIRLQPNVSLTGSSTLFRDGVGDFRVSSDSSAFTGDIVIVGGTINIGSSGSLAGVIDIAVSGQRVSMTDYGRSGNNGWMSGSVTLGSPFGPNNDQLNDSAVLTLSRGTFDYRPNNAVSTETIGQIALAPNGVFASSQGAVGGTLIVSGTPGIVRDVTGTLIINTDSGGLVRANIQVPNTGSLALDTLLPWMPTNYGSYMYIDSSDSNTLKQLAATDAATDLSLWDTTYTSADIVRVVSALPTNSIDANTTVRALTFSTGVNANVTYTIDPGVVLNIAEGAIQKQGNGNNGTIITGGDVTTSASRFFISTGSSNTSRLEIHSRLTGTFDLIKFGIVQLILDGDEANTFLGDVYVNEGLLRLDKNAVEGVAPAAVNGDVYVRTGGGLALGNNGSLPATSNVYLDPDGLLNFTASQTYGGIITSDSGQVSMLNQNITLDNAGYGLVLNGGYWQQNSSAAGTITLQTNVKYEAAATSQMRFERYNPAGLFRIDLGDAERVFDIADSATLAAGVPEMVVDDAIFIGTGSLKKMGTGTLQLTGASTHSGGTVVDQGVLQLARISAPEQSGVTVTTSNAGNLANILTFDAPIASQFVVGQLINNANGGTFPATRYVTGLLNDWQIIVSSNTTTGTYTANFSAVDRIGSLIGPVTVNSGAAFGGTGVVDIGADTAKAVTLASGAKLAMALDGAGAGGDQLDLWNYVSGGLVLNSNSVELSLTGTPVDGTYTVDLIRFFSDGGATPVASGIASGLSLGALPSGIASASLIYATNAIQVQYTVGGGGGEPLVPVLGIVQSGANLIISLASETGFDYQLQDSSDLGDLDPWSAVETKSGTGGTLTFTVAAPAAGNKIFHRVVVPAP